jgi:hypothetical protein
MGVPRRFRHNPHRMRRYFEIRPALGGAALGLFLLILAAWPRESEVIAQAPQQPAPPKLILEGDVALWTVAIKGDRSTDFERIITKLHEGLAKSQNPERRSQAAGWRVMKIAKPLPDGSVAYVHVIDPVVRGADYTVMKILYEEFPDERQALYELYRGAFAQSLSLAVGSMVATTTAP